MNNQKNPTTGQLQGQKKPFSPDDLRTIRAVLSNQQRWRDLALFCVAIDTMLRSGDVLRLKVEDVTDHAGNVLETFTHRQKKTGRGVLCGLTSTARKALERWIEYSNKMPWEYLFTSERNPTPQPITTGHYHRLVKEWARLAALDARHYSGHSTRRTKASLVFRKAGNAETVRQLLGHSSIEPPRFYRRVVSSNIKLLFQRHSRFHRSSPLLHAA